MFDGRTHGASGCRRLVAAGVLAVCCGCSIKDLQTPERYEQGLVIILPGIEGRSHWNYNIARGLAEGGVSSAIEIHDWSAYSVAGWFVNLTYEARNRRVADEVADRIVSYERRYPGRPVQLIGHSGGGGLAIFILEALPRDRQVSSAVLLAAALSPEYDLRKALRRTQYGIWNFYSDKDVGFLKLGTSVFGTIDREYTTAAGCVGFRQPPAMGEEGVQLYRSKLHQREYDSRMAKSGNWGGHTGWASREFSREWLAPLLTSQSAHPRRAFARATGEPASAGMRASAAGPAAPGGAAPADAALPDAVP